MPLRLLLPPIDRPGDDTPVAWCLVDARGVALRSGVDTLAAVPAGEPVEAILPATRVLFARLKLPKVSASTLRELLPYAVEDQLLADPAQVHAVTGATLASGETSVAIVDRAWLESALGWIASFGLRCARAVCETALAPAAPACWHVRLDPAGAWLAEDHGHAVAFDAPNDGEPPLAVRIAVSEARERGTPPAEISVWAAPGAATPDAQAWQAALEAAVRVVAPPPALSGLVRADAIDLLAGDMAHREPRGRALRLPRATWALAATLVLLLVGLYGHDAWRLSREHRALLAEQESLFRTAFPEAKTVVDPPLQLRRNLEGLRRSRGEASTSDFLAAAAEAARTGPVPAKKLTYAQGKLEVEREAPPGAAAKPATGEPAK